MSGARATRVRSVPREKDDLVLALVRMRADGESAHGIAKAFGVHSGIVVQATNAVRDADASESGENVQGFYW